ncbi:hypothetical protein JTF06_05465 [Desemzia sp. RIT804]|uniref:hypothetical protein n=1 Tax=Desemzia sp. RIT 804 TaxID=2810209 RepID=UPI00194F451B|nr:hypothetical protein [Desemzia sp. RIT 804]MBM6614334.1 hypothetical protein [Desemzia sp. RIT 804]
MSYKKDTLFQLAVKHQVDVKKSYTKAKITELLVPEINDLFSNQWSQFTTTEKEQFMQLQSSKEVVFGQLQEWFEQGFLFLYLEREHLKVKMPSEWMDYLSQDITQSNSSKTDEFSVFYRNAVNFKQIFGYTNVHYLVTVWNRYYETKLETEEASKMLKEKNILS